MLKNGGMPLELAEWATAGMCHWLSLALGQGEPPALGCEYAWVQPGASPVEAQYASLVRVGAVDEDSS